MEEKLRKNDHKTEATLMPPGLLLRRLQAEVLELEVALGYESNEQIQREAADVANFALMIYARFAGKTITQSPPPTTVKVQKVPGP